MEISLFGATQSSRWRKQRKMSGLGRVKVSDVVRVRKRRGGVITVVPFTVGIKDLIEKLRVRNNADNNAR